MFRFPSRGGISFNGALSLGDYRYTSNADFTQTRDNSEEVLRGDKVLWKDLRVESTPQTALNLGLGYRGPNNWFISLDLELLRQHLPLDEPRAPYQLGLRHGAASVGQQPAFPVR